MQYLEWRCYGIPFPLYYRITNLTFYILGQDSTLKSFSTIHDSHNKNLGRASFNKTESKRSGLKRDKHMMPPVTAFASGKNVQPQSTRYSRLLIPFFLNQLAISLHLMESSLFDFSGGV